MATQDCDSTHGGKEQAGAGLSFLRESEQEQGAEAAGYLLFGQRAVGGPWRTWGLDVFPPCLWGWAAVLNRKADSAV